MAPEILFDQGLGDLFVLRTAGNVLADVVIGSIEYAVEHLGTNLIMVLGHKRCGAVQSTIDALRTDSRPAGDIGYLVDQIAPAVLSVGLDDPDVAGKAMRAHVAATVARMQDIEGIPEAVAADRVEVVGAVYDLDTGLVDLLP